MSRPKLMRLTCHSSIIRRLMQNLDAECRAMSGHHSLLLLVISSHTSTLQFKYKWRLDASNKVHRFWTTESLTKHKLRGLVHYFNDSHTSVSKTDHRALSLLFRMLWLEECEAYRRQRKALTVLQAYLVFGHGSENLYTKGYR